MDGTMGWANLYCTIQEQYIQPLSVAVLFGSGPCIILTPSSNLAPWEQPQRDRNVGYNGLENLETELFLKQGRQAASSVVVAESTRLARGRLRYLQMPRLRMARVPVHKMMNDS